MWVWLQCLDFVLYAVEAILSKGDVVLAMSKDITFGNEGGGRTRVREAGASGWQNVVTVQVRGWGSETRILGIEMEGNRL